MMLETVLWLGLSRLPSRSRNILRAVEGSPACTKQGQPVSAALSHFQMSLAAHWNLAAGQLGSCACPEAWCGPARLHAYAKVEPWWAPDLCDSEACPHRSRNLLSSLLTLYPALLAQGLQAATGLLSSCPALLNQVLCAAPARITRAACTLFACSHGSRDTHLDGGQAHLLESVISQPASLLGIQLVHCPGCPEHTSCAQHCTTGCTLHVTAA